MDKLHTLELKIALEVKRICENNDIAYFLTAGSLLGAVRHGGFIPWDDDMDIGMLRKDYEKFLKACEKELGAAFFLQTWDTDPEYPFSFAKLRLEGTICDESFSKHNRSIHKGLYVDIFPFDSVPENPKDRKKQARRYFFCRRLLWIKKGMGTNMKKETPRQRMRYNLFRLVSYVFPYEAVKSYYKKVQVRYNHLQTQKVVTDGAYGYEKECLERKWVTNLELVDFETETFLSYKDKIDYLEYFYGDYMQLPPEEKRVGHDMKTMDFGDYA